MQAEFNRDRGFNFNRPAVGEVGLKFPELHCLRRRLHQQIGSGHWPQAFHTAIRRNQGIQHHQPFRARSSRSLRVNRINFRYDPLRHSFRRDGFGRTSHSRLRNRRMRFEFVPGPLPLPPSQTSQRQCGRKQHVDAPPPDANSAPWYSRHGSGHDRFRLRSCSCNFFFFLEISDIHRR